MVIGSVVITAWRVLMLPMEELHPDLEGNYEYIEQTVEDIRQGVALQLGG
jgi:hypothetical protein